MGQCRKCVKVLTVRMCSDSVENQKRRKKIKRATGCTRLKCCVQMCVDSTRVYNDCLFDVGSSWKRWRSRHEGRLWPTRSASKSAFSSVKRPDNSNYRETYSKACRIFLSPLFQHHAFYSNFSIFSFCVVRIVKMYQPTHIRIFFICLLITLQGKSVSWVQVSLHSFL